MVRDHFALPFADKAMALRLGARFDGAARAWYAPTTDVAEALLAHGYRRTVPMAPLDGLVGEDRGFGGQALYVDLIPRSCWFTNVRSSVSPEDWERIKRLVKDRAGHRCEVCGAAERPAEAWWLHTHERFGFDDALGVQALRRLVCVCPDCHEAIHFGLAQVHEREAEARAHLQAVNHWSALEVDEHVREAFRMWSFRGDRSWTLDLSLLSDSGLSVNAPSPEDRQRASRR
jgi:hypothetical protein